MPSDFARKIARIQRLCERAGHDMKQERRSERYANLCCRRCGKKGHVWLETTVPKSVPKCEGRAGE